MYFSGIHRSSRFYFEMLTAWTEVVAKCQEKSIEYVRGRLHFNRNCKVQNLIKTDSVKNISSLDFFERQMQDPVKHLRQRGL